VPRGLVSRLSPCGIKLLTCWNFRPSLAVVSGLVSESEGCESGLLGCARNDRECIAETNLRWGRHRDWTSENVVKLEGRPARREREREREIVRERDS